MMIKRLYPTKERISISARHLASMPFIYGMVLPVLLLDIGLEIYHHACFRLYRIPLVCRSEYFIYDRQFMERLNIVEKVNCFYCSYVNNLFAYACEIAGRTERYWCPIKYERRLNRMHSQYAKFMEADDADSYKAKWKALREFSDLEK